LFLQPHIRYQLPDGAKLHLADVSAVYHRLCNGLDVDDEDSSETGSESMLAVNNSVVEGKSLNFLATIIIQGHNKDMVVAHTSPDM
jgi:hypothetical protein